MNKGIIIQALWMLRHPTVLARYASFYYRKYILNRRLDLTELRALKEQSMPCKDMYAKLTSDKSDIFHNELNNDEKYKYYLEIAFKSSADGNVDIHLATFLYCIIRRVKPKIVVETGVANGISTSYILLALHNNQKGHLFSIDIPNYSLLRKNKEPGWAVPQYLRDRWTLIRQTSQKALPSLCLKIGHIDVFFHDSEHTYPIQLFEYQTVWPHLSHRGVIISDDIADSSAFLSYHNSMKSSAYMGIMELGLNRYAGILLKTKERNTMYPLNGSTQ